MTKTMMQKSEEIRTAGSSVRLKESSVDKDLQAKAKDAGNALSGTGQWLGRRLLPNYIGEDMAPGNVLDSNEKVKAFVSAAYQLRESILKFADKYL